MSNTITRGVVVPQPLVQLADDELAVRIARADHAAFETLMRRHNGRLFRVARTILKDEAEAEDALQETYLEAGADAGVENAAVDDVVDETGESPPSAMLRAEIRNILEQRIDELPVAFRTVFVMREVEDMTVQETAECLSIPEATVRTRLFRARALLREAIARDMDLATLDVFRFAGERCDRIVETVLFTLGSDPSRR
jgi:RNA polymerase sigma-70 factor, ECF subfamily